jgi:hypothetical protein
MESLPFVKESVQGKTTIEKLRKKSSSFPNSCEACWDKENNPGIPAFCFNVLLGHVATNQSGEFQVHVSRRGRLLKPQRVFVSAGLLRCLVTVMENEHGFILSQHTCWGKPQAAVVLCALYRAMAFQTVSVPNR